MLRAASARALREARPCTSCRSTTRGLQARGLVRYPSGTSNSIPASTASVASPLRRWSTARTPVLSCGMRVFSSTASSEEKLEFQAETRQLLDIVTHSIYTDKEVFLRELISNASDAMEKLRHLQVVGEAVEHGSAPLEISITTDEENRTLTIQDTGVGMTKEELKSNLGTIARSGSKAFLKELKGGAGGGGEGAVSSDALGGIIGQFGVGFYSAFMVGDEVTVYSRSARDGSCSVWTSDGSGEFTVSDLAGGGAGGEAMPRGCKIVIKLREGCEEYASKDRVDSIVKKYSNFVGVPIKLNGEAVNTVEAIWMKSPSEVEDAKYKEFYQFIAHAFDTPITRIHFRTDAPIELKALFFFPTYHTEKFGMGRMEPGISLYSRKVLIEAKSPDILPEWLRFVKGVVDSEDLPLSLSREKPQDSVLIKKIGGVLTRKILRHLQDLVKKDPEKFKGEFFKEFGPFLKEGICQDYTNQAEIAKLLFFESNKGETGELVSLDEYISRCVPEQKEIYYLCAPNRDLAEASPYYETFRSSGREVLFVYNAIDDFVMTNLGTYGGRALKTAEADDINFNFAEGEKGGTEGKDGLEEGLGKEDAEDLCRWLKESALPDRVMEVKTTSRLSDSPAIVSNHESGALRRMMRMVEQQNSGQAAPMPKQKIEINPKHPLMVSLQAIKTSHPSIAQMVAEQVFDNALVAAGLMDDSRVMLPRLNQIMGKALAGLQGAGVEAVAEAVAAGGEGEKFLGAEAEGDGAGGPKEQGTSSAAR